MAKVKLKRKRRKDSYDLEAKSKNLEKKVRFLFSIKLERKSVSKDSKQNKKTENSKEIGNKLVTI